MDISLSWLISWRKEEMSSQKRCRGAWTQEEGIVCVDEKETGHRRKHYHGPWLSGLWEEYAFCSLSCQVCGMVYGSHRKSKQRRWPRTIQLASSWPPDPHKPWIQWVAVEAANEVICCAAMRGCLNFSSYGGKPHCSWHMLEIFFIVLIAHKLFTKGGFICMFFPSTSVRFISKEVSYNQ